MERQFDQELEDVRRDLVRMGAEVEEMVGRAMGALVDRDSAAADGVLERDRVVDDLEKKIDDDCHTLLVRYQPAARDLRFLMAVLRITNDLERVGDCSKNISRSVLVLNEEPQLKPYIDLPRMSKLVGAMVHDSLNAFVRRDNELALAVCQRDNEIDSLYEQLFRELLTFMMEDPSTVKRALQLLFVAHNLERIADHATNIAEDVIYYLEARDIRHTPEATGAESAT